MKAPYILSFHRALSAPALCTDMSQVGVALFNIVNEVNIMLMCCSPCLCAGPERGWVLGPHDQQLRLHHVWPRYPVCNSVHTIQFPVLVQTSLQGI